MLKFAGLLLVSDVNICKIDDFHGNFVAVIAVPFNLIENVSFEMNVEKLWKVTCFQYIYGTSTTLLFLSILR